MNMHHLIIALFSACLPIMAMSTSFEVATVKVSPPLNPADIVAGRVKVGETLSGMRVSYDHVSLQYLLCKAYKVKDYQVSGPSWVKTSLYDVSATFPDADSKSQLPEMLQTLLKERFNLGIHRDTKEQSVYVLVLGKQGSKMRESSEAEFVPEGSPVKLATSKVAGNTGLSIQSATGNVTSFVDENKIQHFKFSRMEVATVASFVSQLVHKPVLDETGLKGRYDAEIDVPMADMLALASRAGVQLPPASSAQAQEASDPGSSSIFDEIQKLGLKLEPKKLSIDVIVVDGGSQIPAEN